MMAKTAKEVLADLQAAYPELAGAAAHTLGSDVKAVGADIAGLTRQAATEILTELNSAYAEAKSAYIGAAEVSKTVPGTLERFYTNVAGYFRMSGWGIMAAVLAAGVYFLMPQEIEVAHWKAVLVIAAAFIGYWLDRTLFPYARPHTLTADENDFMWSKDDPQGHVFVGCMMRRVVLVAATMIAAGMAL